MEEIRLADRAMVIARQYDEVMGLSISLIEFCQSLEPGDALLGCGVGDDEDEFVKCTCLRHSIAIIDGYLDRLNPKLYKFGKLNVRNGTPLKLVAKRRANMIAEKFCFEIPFEEAIKDERVGRVGDGRRVKVRK